MESKKEQRHLQLAREISEQLVSLSGMEQYEFLVKVKEGIDTHYKCLMEQAEEGLKSINSHYQDFKNGNSPVNI